MGVLTRNYISAASYKNSHTGNLPMRYSNMIDTFGINAGDLTYSSTTTACYLYLTSGDLDTSLDLLSISETSWSGTANSPKTFFYLGDGTSSATIDDITLDNVSSEIVNNLSRAVKLTTTYQDYWGGGTIVTESFKNNSDTESVEVNEIGLFILCGASNMDSGVQHGYMVYRHVFSNTLVFEPQDIKTITLEIT